MAKMGCAKCGGTKKMEKGGTTKSVSISKPGAGVVKETKGDTNQKMGIYGIAQTGPTGPNDSGIATMKKGGSVNINKKTSVMKKIKKMDDGGMTSTKTNIFGKSKSISNSKALDKVSKFAKKSGSTIKSSDDKLSYTIKPRANSNRSVTTTFEKKAGGTVKTKKK